MIRDVEPLKGNSMLPPISCKAIVVILVGLALLPPAAFAQQASSSQFEYDSQSNLIKFTDPNGKVTDLVPDNLDRLQKQTLPKPTAAAARPEISYTYDALNRLTSIKDAKGAITTYTPSGLDDLTQQSPDTNSLVRNYNKTGQLNLQTNHKDQQSEIQYDPLNRPKYIWYYDEAGQYLGQTLFGYDAYNTTSGSENYGRGRLTTVAEFDANGLSLTSTAFRYDQLGRITRRCQFISGADTATACTETDALYYRWGAISSVNAGRLVGLTYPSGRKVDYQFDALGHITGITTTHPNGSSAITVLSNIVYTPLAMASNGYAIKSWNFGATPSTPQQSYRRGYDTSGRPSYFTLGRGAFGVTNSINQLYLDDAGRVMTINSYTDTGSLQYQTYGYDDLNRLRSANLNGTTYSYDYDANGNRTLKTTSVVSTAYTYSGISGRLATVKVGAAASQAITTDSVGNITQDPVAPAGNVKYIYDNRNLDPYGRLIKTQGPGAQYSYLNNNFGQRLRKTGAIYTPAGGSAINPVAYIGSTDTVFQYDLQGHLIAEQDASTKQIKREYIWLGDTPVAVIAGSTPTSMVTASNIATVYYVHTDYLSTPRLVTDTAGKKRWNWSMVTNEPFGASAANEAPESQVAAQQFTLNLRFPGQYLDKETGTFYNYHRTYNPATGRYVQSDPIGLDGGLNTYGYANGNSLSNIDPYGLWTVEVGGYLGGGGALTFGRDPSSGTGFMALKLGKGLGFGAAYDPLGGRAGGDATQCGKGGVGVGFFAQGGGNLGPLSANVEANVGKNYFGWFSSSSSYGGVSPKASLDTKWGIGAGAAAGVEFTVFGQP
ncbi:RHS repeat-associated core domain-containing protein [Aquabacterium sp. CECT 9606]|uniref:RHS repeat-associated core domain-containing protein n=1 Tax=Aquabacterium sp. CECT 9606 TaxID=2845822 RepID=UPI001E291078|nr:RHS repeat-associated core domain-containing protein [Aquabacterium sp. CECT 9606]CAH0353093.1 hypothetical protein AQB9606_03058 [Aquabacterium sp. CECT 9606]